jgi:hypothetical protein
VFQENNKEDTGWMTSKMKMGKGAGCRKEETREGESSLESKSRDKKRPPDRMGEMRLQIPELHCIDKKVKSRISMSLVMLLP